MFCGDLAILLGKVFDVWVTYGLDFEAYDQLLDVEGEAMNQF